MVKINWYKQLSQELGRCYIEQNGDLSDEELEEALIDDETILQGELMGMLLELNELEEL